MPAQARSWKKYANVLASGSSSAIAPAIGALPVSAYAIANAIVKWTAAKVAVLARLSVSGMRMAVTPGYIVNVHVR